MSDLLTSGSTTQERKYLHDYSYTRFENELDNSDKIVRITVDNAEDTIHQVSGTKFVAVQGKLAFHDIDAVRNVLSKFNELGEAISYVSAFPPTPTGANDNQGKAGGPRRGGGQSSRSETNRRLAIAKEEAKSAGMALDPTYVKKLGEILDLGYEGLFYVSLDVGPYVFTATVQRQNFREPDELLIRKYARFSGQDFVLVGAVVRGLMDFDADHKPAPNVLLGDPGSETLGSQAFEISDLRDSVENFTGILDSFDRIFSGKRANEVVLDPIALYREI